MGLLDKLPMLLQVAAVAGVFCGALMLGGLIAAMIMRARNGNGHGAPKAHYVTRSDLDSYVTRPELQAADYVSQADLLQAVLEANSQRQLERQGLYARIDAVRADFITGKDESASHLSAFSKSMEGKLTDLDARLRSIERSLATIAGAEQERARQDKRRGS